MYKDDNISIIMDISKSTNNPNPREGTNLLSIISWWWTINIFRKGYKKVLGTEDLYDPLKKDESRGLGDKLEIQWKSEIRNAQKTNHHPKLFKAIFRTFLCEYSFLAFFQIFNQFFLSLGIPILLGELLKYFKPKPTTTYEKAILFAAGISVATGIQIITSNYASYGTHHAGGRIRIAVCSLIYRKALRLSKTALGETAPGKIVNLVANDVNRFDIVSPFIHHLWSAPLLTLIIAYILYSEAGYAGLTGIVAVFFIVPMQSYLGKLSSRFRLQTALKTDERVRLMDEIISGIQVIKMYAWEESFCSLIEHARKLELRVVKKSGFIRGIYMTFNVFTTRMALWCTLMAMLLMGDNLTADKVFVFTSYYGTLTQTMSGMFVRGFAEIAECMVVIKRLENFLKFEEYKETNVTREMFEKRTTIKDEDDDICITNDVQEKDIDEPWVVKFDSVTAAWNNNSSNTILENIDVTFAKGKLYAIIGMVGSGKSSFLSTILGEVNVLQGNVKVKGNISYADQDAWIFGSSVRQNILFGQEFDRQRYQRVVKACALLKDFKQFHQGDETIVGERGSFLSGGQKARINLARCLYRQADIYLLDDPLSAVDVHVGKHLFRECLQKYLNDKTCILATHQLQYVTAADSILLLNQGKLIQYSDYRELLRQHPEYRWLIFENEYDDEADDIVYERALLLRQFSSASSKSTQSYMDIRSTDEEELKHEEEHTNIEKTSQGAVKGNILLKYLRVGASYPLVLILLLLFLGTQLLASFNDYFIKVFVNAEESRAYYKEPYNHETTILNEDEILPQNVYIGIYTGIVFSIFFVGIARSLSFYSICLRCSQRLHDSAFGALIRANMRFFDTNPSGRLLNRFSKDMGALDELLPKALLDAAQVMLISTGTLIVTCSVNPVFLVPMGFIGIAVYWIRKVYLKTSKNLKRLEGMTRSPVFTHLNATLNGLVTIRAYQAQNILKQEFDNLQDLHTSSWFMFIATGNAFGFILDLFFLIFTTLVIFSFFVIQKTFSGGEVGLAISQIILMSSMVQWGLRQSTEAANQMLAVERVIEYTQIPPENNIRRKDVKLKKRKKVEQKCKALTEVPSNWPNRGFIEFKNVCMRYSDDSSPVLKNLTLTIQPTEKVGIVGRTGAGKSSLISALFRLAKVEGAIEIDGVDTGVIALEDLRRNISIIPQSPVLFSGTLRRNLDPFNEFSDTVLWEVLEEVELKDAVTGTGNGLDHKVLDRGSNYSVGQRQLICLSRAILRNSKVLMLDEATANVDPQTDALIQRTIRTKFAKCTVLTVAHRLNTIMDSDKVLVMDRGCAVEYDHPHLLLQNENGQFTSLVKELGVRMYQQLCEVVRDAFVGKHGVRL